MSKNIKSIVIGSDTFDTRPYYTCSTAAATAAKTVGTSGGGFSLATGVTVLVKFTKLNSASSPTLNVEGSGAKAMFYKGAAISASYLKASSIDLPFRPTIELSCRAVRP